jgi:hypothetical protein
MASLEELQAQRDKFSQMMQVANPQNQMRIQTAINAIDREIEMQQPAAPQFPMIVGGEPAPVREFPMVTGGEPPPPAAPEELPMMPPSQPLRPSAGSFIKDAAQTMVGVPAAAQPTERIPPSPERIPLQIPQIQRRSSDEPIIEDTQPRNVDLNTVPAQERTVGVDKSQVGAIPFETTTQTVQKSGVRIPDAARKVLEAELSPEGQSQADIENRKNRALQLGADIEFEQKQAALDTEEFRTLQAEREQAFQEQIQKEEEELNKEATALSEQKIDSSRFWKNQDTGGIIISTIAAILGGIGQGLAGGRNQALDTIMKVADADVKEQIRDLDAKKARNKEQLADLTTRRARFKSDEAFKENLLATRLQAVAQKVEGLKAKADSQEKADALDDLAKSLRIKSADAIVKMAQLETPQTQTVTTTRRLSPTALAGKAKKPEKFTVDQTNANVFANRMLDAEKNFEVLRKEYEPQALSAGIGRFLPNIFKSEQAQQFEQLKRNFVTAVLRKESGAAISPEEFKTEELKYFPQTGDSLAVLNQKREARLRAIQGMQQAAGGAFERAVLPGDAKQGSRLRQQTNQ